MSSSRDRLLPAEPERAPETLSASTSPPRPSLSSTGEPPNHRELPDKRRALRRLHQPCDARPPTSDDPMVAAPEYGVRPIAPFFPNG
ncbi:vegetative cell wall protein gp1-like [Iris pallida]|uniref:Vegetative cell wall protein gp1-like n=1 Tax=Iris pallida TaxID=29817 RepID=A0AAX6F9I2_IRIPA|nr:vegetative cell wall protein gp1-like [Iris pallida]